MKKTFWGYPRPDGSYGVRNYVAVISTADNSNFAARRVAQQVYGTVPLCPCFGRGEIGADMDLHVKTLGGLGANPNVHSAVILSLEPVIAQRVAEIIRASGKRAEIFTFDEYGDTVSATEKAIRAAKKLAIEASMVRREETGLGQLTLGVECGGSDTTSGVISNPATGLVADAVVDAGGTVILSETTEWMGAEEMLGKRCVDPETAERIRKAIQWYEDYIKSIGVDLNGFNPAPDNIKGGLSTIEEKALGSIKKGGSRAIQEMVTCSERPRKKGLVLMDAPTGGVENTTALAAAGCQLIIFSTGKGNPLGNPIAPTIKVTGNIRTVKASGENIDVDLSAVMTEDMAIEDAGELLLERTVDHADGKLTSAEVLGDVEIAVTRYGCTV